MSFFLKSPFKDGRGAFDFITLRFFYNTQSYTSWPFKQRKNWTTDGYLTFIPWINRRNSPSSFPTPAILGNKCSTCFSNGFRLPNTHCFLCISCPVLIKAFWLQPGSCFSSYWHYSIHTSNWDKTYHNTLVLYIPIENVFSFWIPYLVPKYSSMYQQLQQRLMVQWKQLLTVSLIAIYIIIGSDEDAQQ